MKHWGKYLVCLLICLLLVGLVAAASADVEINETNFPDSWFRHWMEVYYDSDDNGIFSDVEIASVNEIPDYVLNDVRIKSLKGIEFFTELQYLTCNETQIASLDVSKNKKLLSLGCQNCVRLKSLTLGSNTVLCSLGCYNTKLEILDISKCPKLVNLVQSVEPIYYSDGSILYENRQHWYLCYDSSTKLIVDSSTITDITKPEVTTGKASNIGPTYATVSFSIVNTGGAQIKEAGIQYSYDKETINTKILKSAKDVGEYSVKLTSLNASHNVYYRAYARNTKGPAYGDWKKFKTKVDKPTVKTLEAKNVYLTEADLGIHLKKNGGANVTDCGLYWGYSKREVNEHENQLSFGPKNEKKGKFYDTVKNLVAGKTIFYQAYAVNKVGTDYGDILKTKLPVARSLSLLSAHIWINDTGHRDQGKNATKTMHKIFKLAGCDPDAAVRDLAVTNDKLNDYLSALAEVTTDSDITYIYILAHGSDYSFCLNPGDPGAFGYKRYSYSSLIKRISKIKGSIVLFLNPCHSGSVVYSTDVPEIGALNGRLAYMASSRYDENAYFSGNSTELVASVMKAFTQYPETKGLKAQEFFKKVKEYHDRVSLHNTQCIFGGNSDMVVFYN